MAHDLLVAGGGIAGLAAAVAARRAGWEVRLFEQAEAFTEVGAGLQLGPNATRLLRDWGVVDAHSLKAFEPQRLSVRDAVDGREIGSLRLAGRARARYGAPYLTVHRADLHATLLEAAAAAGTHLHAGVRIHTLSAQGACAGATLQDGTGVEADAVAIADGVWSRLREALLAGGGAPATGHVAYRALVPMADWPPALRGDEVQAWLGPRMHLVRYPVRGGEAMNVAAFIEGSAEAGWDHAARPEAVREAARALCAELQGVVDAVESWRLWPVHDRPPVESAGQLAQGRAALLGDAAHPMRPYLAQGAGMAIEDADALGRALSLCEPAAIDVPLALRRYALERWQRVARVQARSRRNGRIFHAAGPLRMARNLAMRAGGERLLDVPWLYGSGD